MDVGKLRTPHDAFGCVYYFSLDEQQPDAPRREATRYYYVLTTPSASCSEAFLFLCRSLCAPDQPRTRMERWYKVYQSTFARLAFDAFVALVRESAYWDRLSHTRRAPPSSDDTTHHEGCLQLFTDESSARAALERHRLLELARRSSPSGGTTADVVPGTTTSAAVRADDGCAPQPHEPRPASRRPTTAVPSSATPEKAARDSDSPALIEASEKGPSSASARTAPPPSARPRAPLGIATHHLNSLDDSGVPLPTERVIELSADDRLQLHRRYHPRADDSDANIVTDSQDTNNKVTYSPISSIRAAADLSATGSSWPAPPSAASHHAFTTGAASSTSGLPEDLWRVVATHVQDLTDEKNERLYRELRAVHHALRHPRSTHSRSSRHDVDGAGEPRFVSSTSSEDVHTASRRPHRSSTKRVHDDQGAELQRAKAALASTTAALAEERTRYHEKALHWQDEAARLQKELNLLSTNSTTRLHDLIQDNQREVTRIEATFAEKEAEIRQMYGLALQNRDVRLVQLSEELGLAQQRERDAVSREGAAKAELAQWRQRCQDQQASHAQLERQLRDARDRLALVRGSASTAVPPPPATTSYGSDGQSRHNHNNNSDNGSDELLAALRGAEQRYSASFLHGKRLETEVDQVRTLLAEKESELAKAHALIRALQDGLQTVRLELPVLREEWRREFMQAAQASSHASTP